MDEVKRMDKQWEIKAMVTQEAYREFAVWCIEHKMNTSDVLRVVTLAAKGDDKRLNALVKDYDPEEARP